jgi:DNA invertase Pin-like site-specific DNA recombinase
MLFGYARVSTDDQNLALQLDAMDRAGVLADKIYTDKASGVAVKRVGLEECLRALEPGDVLIVWKLDRLARSLRQLIDIADYLEKRGVGLKSLSEAMDTTTPGGRQIFNVMGAIGQFERDLIRERTRAGMQSAIARGVKVGRKLKSTKELISQAKVLIVAGKSVEEAADELGMGKSTLFRDLKGWDRKTLDPMEPYDPDNDVEIPTV